MITLDQIMNSQSDILKGTKIKLVRHSRKDMDYYRDVLKDRNTALEYQKEQGSDLFKDCDYIMSFFATESTKSVFFGVFKVNGYELIDNKYYYNLEHMKEFEKLEDRLIIDWGKNQAIAWHQWYNKNKNKEVIEIIPKGYIGNFPGLLNFTLEFHELKNLINNPDAHKEWKHHLSSVNGIYIIWVDDNSGAQYIGSASGKNGIWQRWSDYAKTKTGGNKKLKLLLKKDPNCYKNFKFSILQTLPSNMLSNDVVKHEKFYKNKLGTKVVGLNDN